MGEHGFRVYCSKWEAKKITKIVLFLCCFLFTIQYSFGQVIVPNAGIVYVSPSGSGNGNNWLQAANIANAISGSPSNSILHLRGGTYNVLQTLVVNRRLQILGGFTGTGASRNIVGNPSVLNGGTAVTIMRTSNSSSNTIIDGLTFLDGYAAPGIDVNDIKPGALEIGGSSTTITNCIFRNNVSRNRIGSSAIYLWSSDNIIIDNCHFENNRVEENTSSSGNIGGTIHVRFGENTQISNSVFRNNSSFYSGGAVNAWGERVNISNCRFQNNRSIDKGGAIYVNFDDATVSNCDFRDNSALDGGAIYNNSASTKVINSLFVSNQASNLAGAIFNGEELSVTNSTFVRNSNTAIVFMNNSPTEYSNYKTDIYNSIFFANTKRIHSQYSYIDDISASSGTANTLLSTINIRRNILQESTLGSDNQIAVDPLFENNVNDFTLQSNSPAVNGGLNNLFNQVSATAAGSSIDLANNQRVFGSSIDLGAYELQEQSTAPNPPTAASPQNFCEAGTVADLQATGTNLRWYLQSSGGTALVGTTVLTTRMYYVSQTVGGIESERRAVSVVISNTAAPVVVNQSFCGAVTVANLLATGTNIRWYNTLTGGTALTSTTALSTRTYYASQTVGTCESDRSAVVVTISNTVPPTAINQTFCGAQTVADLVATGVGLRWYTVETGGTNLTANIALSSRRYYVSQTVSGCESIRIGVDVVINAPSAPLVSAQSFCNSATVADLVATGDNLRWYLQASGGTEINPSTALSTRLYYVSQTVGGCQSPRRSVQVTINTVPLPTTSAQSFCETSSVADLRANGTDLRWYNTAVGGTALTTTAPLVSGTYYVSQTVGSCESNRRAVVVTVGTAAAPESTDQSFCPSATVADLVAEGIQLAWYRSETAGTALASTEILTSGAYYVSQTIGTCTSERTPINVSIGNITAPNISEINICGRATVASLDRFGLDLAWYRDNVVTAPLGSDVVLSSGTYYVSRIQRNCESNRVPVNVVVSMTAPPIVPNQNFIPGSTYLDLDVTGEGLRWYTSGTGLTEFDPSVTIQNGVIYISQTINGCESDRVILNVEISQTPISVTFPNSTRIYTGQPQSLEVTGALPSGVNVQYENNLHTDVGIYQVTATLTGENFQTLILEAELTITAARVNVTANEISKTYGEADPLFTYEVEGLVGADNLGEILSGALTRDDGERVGEYAIHLGTLNLGANYIANINVASLTILPANLLITARDSVKIMDNVAFFGGNGVDAVGLQFADQLSDLSGDLIFRGNSQGAQYVGEYEIIPGGLSSVNYNITYASGNLSISYDQVEFPNVITPNGDNLNDRFVFRHIYNLDYADIIIYNIDGLEVYKSLDYQDDFTGQGLNKGTYYYIVHFTNPQNPTQHNIKKGFITIL